MRSGTVKKWLDDEELLLITQEHGSEDVCSFTGMSAATSRGHTLFRGKKGHRTNHVQASSFPSSARRGSRGGGGGGGCGVGA